MNNKQQLLDRIEKMQLKREDTFNKGNSTKQLDKQIDRLVTKYKMMEIKER